MSTTIAKVRISTTQNRKLGGYNATLHIMESHDCQYKIRTQVFRVWPSDAIKDGMDQAQELAQRNNMRFVPTHTNAGRIEQCSTDHPEHSKA